MLLKPVTNSSKNQSWAVQGLKRYGIIENYHSQSLHTRGLPLVPGQHTNAQFGLKYDGGIFVGGYSSYYAPVPEPYPHGTTIMYSTIEGNSV